MGGRGSGSRPGGDDRSADASGEGSPGASGGSFARRTQDKEKRRDPGQVPPLSGPTWEGHPGGPAGRGGVEMRWSCEGAAFGAVTLSLRCGRWPQPQNDARRWWRRVRDVEIPWSGRRPPPVATGAAVGRTGSGASWRAATRRAEVFPGPSERRAALRARLRAPGGGVSCRGSPGARPAPGRSAPGVRGVSERSW